MTESDLRNEINKRLTLNWLIQGAAQHAGMTCHHLVAEELADLHPKLLRLYDRFALMGLIQYWRFLARLIFGRPSRFWKRAANNPNHPFFKHRLLSQYGGMLADAARERALASARSKRVRLYPGTFTIKFEVLMFRIILIEFRRKRKLIELAKKVTSEVWGISPDRLHGEMSLVDVEWGDLGKAESKRGRLLRFFAGGYGGVRRSGDSFEVVGKAMNWWVLNHEFVKGTAELICLHGINKLPPDTYEKVMRAADRIEFEPWMMQSGCELWRRLLLLLPEKRPLAEMLMHIARLPAVNLDALIGSVIEDPDLGREMLAELGRSDSEVDVN